MYLIEHAMCGVFICCQKFGNSTRKSFNVLDSDFGKGPQSREATEQISVLCSLLRRLHIVLLNAELYFFFILSFLLFFDNKDLKFFTIIDSALAISMLSNADG